jgi:hypothetical protein
MAPIRNGVAATNGALMKHVPQRDRASDKEHMVAEIMRRTDDNGGDDFRPVPQR